MKIVFNFYLLVGAFCYLSVITARSASESEGAESDFKLPKSFKAKELVEKAVDPYCKNCDVLIIGAVSGTFTSPNFPNAYCNNINCSYAIEVGPDLRIRLTFTYFQTETGFDPVKVYDGPSVNDTLLLEASGGYFQQGPVVNSTSNQMLMIFKTDETITYSGWSATFQTF